MFIQVFKKTDGTPKLIQGMTVPETLEIEYEYDTDIYTEITPDDGLYDPIHFDGEQWIGTSKEEWEAGRPPSEPYKPEATEILLARTQLQIAKMASLQEKAQQELAKAIQEIAKLQGGN